jgi:TldD protein
MDAGAGYCDARFYSEDGSETLVLYDGNLESNSSSFESGLGVRVLYGGAWGFAATSRASDVSQAFDKALANARTAAMLVSIPLDMGVLPGVKGSYSSPVVKDPFEVPLKEKLAFLTSVDDRLGGFRPAPGCLPVLQRMRNRFWNSEGSVIDRT